MDVKIYYFQGKSLNYQVESFNCQAIDFTFISDFDELIKKNNNGLIDVLIIDDLFINQSDKINKLLAVFDKKNKVYLMLNEFALETVQWALNQNWIDKIIPTEGNDFVLNNTVIKTITKDTALLMENRKLIQDNRELEFVISQMMLAD